MKHDNSLVYQAFMHFKREYAKAQTAGLKEPTAVTLATAGKDGRLSIRTVLLKGVDERGFVFFTNKESRKGRQLMENPQAALCFYWPPLNRQVTVEGKVKEVPAFEADAYWATRPRQSQIGAWASLQSRPLKSRGALLLRVGRLIKQFGLGPIPRPPHWTGFRLMPSRIEFWKAKPFRLHERIVYEKRGGEWIKNLLYP